MRRLYLLALPLLTALLALSATAQDKPITTPYYPLKVGNEWTYRSGKETVVVRVDRETTLELKSDDKANKPRKVAGFTLAIRSGPREREATEQVVVLADGVYRFSAGGKAIQPPLCFLKLPIKPGESWSIDSKTADGKPIHGQFVTGTESIQFMLGRNLVDQKTITVTSKDFRINNELVSIKYWFAEDIGIVKQLVQIGRDAPVTLELRSFKVGR